MLLINIINSIAKSFIGILFRVKVYGIENLPPNGKCIICSNHISNFDPLILRKIITREVSFMAKKELFDNKILNYLLKNNNVFPVERDKLDIAAYRNAINILKSENALCMFIQGTRSKNLDKAKDGAAMFAIKTNAPVIPVCIVATYKPFSKVKVVFGKQIVLSNSESSHTKDFSAATIAIVNAIRELEGEN